MGIIGELAWTLQSALGSALEEIGRRSRAIRRRRKFTGPTLLRTIVLTAWKSPGATTDDFVATAARLGVTVSPQAIEKRFTEPLIAFLRMALEHVLGHALAAPPAAIPLLRRFTAVELADSSTVTVPERYAEEFPGCGGTSDGGKAAVKIQLRWDLLGGRLKRLVVEPGRRGDGRNEEAEAPVTRGALYLRDLGYFGLAWFRELAAAGAYWISRLQQRTVVLDRDGEPLELLRTLRGHEGGGPVDMPILLGKAERLACRLIALRVPQEMAARRRQKAYEKAEKQGRMPSRDHLAWCEWTILVTNCPGGLLTWKEAVVLYRSRWQVELMFKLWKSHNRLAAYRATWTATERMAMFWAKLIAVVLQHWILLASVWTDPRRSLWKAARVIGDWVLTLTGALGDLDQLVRTLERLVATLAAAARQKLQKKRPSSFQLLLNPKLLNWNS